MQEHSRFGTEARSPRDDMSIRSWVPQVLRAVVGGKVFGSTSLGFLFGYILVVLACIRFQEVEIWFRS